MEYVAKKSYCDSLFPYGNFEKGEVCRTTVENNDWVILKFEKESNSRILDNGKKITISKKMFDEYFDKKENEKMVFKCKSVSEAGKRLGFVVDNEYDNLGTYFSGLDSIEKINETYKGIAEFESIEEVKEDDNRLKVGDRIMSDGEFIQKGMVFEITKIEDGRIKFENKIGFGHMSLEEAKHFKKVEWTEWKTVFDGKGATRNNGIITQLVIKGESKTYCAKCTEEDEFDEETGIAICHNKYLIDSFQKRIENLKKELKSM